MRLLLSTAPFGRDKAASWARTFWIIPWSCAYVNDAGVPVDSGNSIALASSQNPVRGSKTLFTRVEPTMVIV